MTLIERRQTSAPASSGTPLDYNIYAPPWAYPHKTMNFTTSTTTTEKPEDPETCPDRTSTTGDGSIESVIGMNILISFILFVIGMGVFVFATRSARNQTRRPLLRRNESVASDWIRVFYSQKIVEDELGSSRTSNETTSDIVNDASADELGFWVPVFWFWKREEIERRCGKSATQYLRFMENVQIFTAIVVVFGTLVILPLNLQGKMVTGRTDFGRTTLLNILPKSHLLWVHVALSIILFPLAVYFMKKFGQTFRGYTYPFQATKTLMFDHLSTKNASEARLQQHFQEGFPEAAIDDIKLTYRTSDLIKLDKELHKCTACLRYYERTVQLGEDRPSYSQDNLCIRCCCFCCEVGVDAMEFYSSRTLELENKIEELIDAPKKLTNKFFVTFNSENEAEKVLSNYRHIWKSVFSPKTSVSSLLRARLWTAKYSPYPEFINWENLEINGLKWYLWATLLNIGLFLFLFFITSPVIILNALGLADWGRNLPILNQIIPALVLIELGLVIGGLVRFTTKRTRYHEKITGLLVVMKGSFVYTLISQLILPTFGLTSVKALYDYLVVSKKVEKFNWACVFLPDNGMVFVTFFVYQSLLGTSLSFSRIIELQIMAIRRGLKRSDAEKHLISQKKQTFRFTTSYSANIVLVSIVIVFAYIVPYVGPFGLFAIMMKHVSERYNIFFVNRVEEVPDVIHKTAVQLFLFAVLLELYIFIFFMGIRSSLVGMGALVATVVVYTSLFVYITWRKTFGRISKAPIIGTFANHLDDEDDKDSYDPVAEPKNYEAPILRRYEMLRPLTSGSSKRASDALWEE